MSGKPKHIGLAMMAIGMLFAAASHGAETMASFGQRYGASPRSTENGGKGRGAAARVQRAARKARRVAKHRRERA